MTAGVDLIAAERERQIRPVAEGGEGWDARHDQGASAGLAKAAAAYALPPGIRTMWFGLVSIKLRRMLWPWSEEWWKPLVEDGELFPDREKRVRELVKAGALIAAAIDSELARE